MKRIVLWILIPLILFLVLFIALYAFSSRIINQESVKNRIKVAISEELGGQFSYERVRLSIFPQPRVVIQGLNISIPKSLSGSMKALDIYPELWPLLTGKLQFAKVLLERPDVNFSLLGNTEDRSGVEPQPEPSPDQTLITVLGFVASRMPTLTIVIEQGRLTFNQGDQRLFSLQEVESRIAFLPAESASNGSPLVPSEENFRMIGSVQGILTEGERLPGPVRIAVGRFEVLPLTISISDTHIQVLDTSLSVSGRLDDYLTALRKADLRFTGTAGSETVRWIHTAASLPPELTLHAPVAVSQAHLFWSRSGTTRLEGEASVQRDLSLSFDVSWGEDRLVVKDLRIRDRESQATLTWSIEKKVLNLAFAGNLTQSTLNRLLEQERFQFGWLRGNLRARVVLERPAESTAQGTLEGEQLVFPIQLKIPVTIDRISLRATDRTVTLDPLILALGTNHHTITGKITASADGWLLDLTSDGLEWESLQELFSRDTAGDESAMGGPRQVPVRATIRLSSRYFTAGQWTVAPARAEISLGSDGLRISLDEAVVCGINLPGTVTVTPADTQIDLSPFARRQELESTLACLASKNLSITGTFDLSGTLSTRGPQQNLIKDLRGTITITAKDGHVYYAPVLMRVLTYLNTTALLRGNYAGLDVKGVPYESFNLRGKVENGIVAFEEAVFLSPIIKMAGRGSINLSDRTIDITVLVAPFKIADTVVQKIPLLRDILAGSLVTIPVHIEGPLEQPKVMGIPPVEVAKGLVGIMQRTLQLPFKIIEPVIPGHAP